MALNAYGVGMITNSVDPKFCGKCVTIAGPNGVITAKVVDACYGLYQSSTVRFFEFFGFLVFCLYKFDQHLFN